MDSLPDLHTHREKRIHWAERGHKGSSRSGDPGSGVIVFERERGERERGARGRERERERE